MPLQLQLQLQPWQTSFLLVSYETPPLRRRFFMYHIIKIYHFVIHLF